MALGSLAGMWMGGCVSHPGCCGGDCWTTVCGVAVGGMLAGNGVTACVGGEGPLGNGEAVGERFSAIGLRNRRFLSVTLPEPSTLTRYCLWGSTSIMRPDLFHFPLVSIMTGVWVTSGAIGWAFAL